MINANDPPPRISDVPPFGLRMLPDLKKRIEEAAEKSRRSINAEIVARLEESLQNEKFAFMNVPLEDRIKELEEDVAILKAAVLIDQSKVAASLDRFVSQADLYKEEFRHLLPKKG